MRRNEINKNREDFKCVSILGRNLEALVSCNHSNLRTTKTGLREEIKLVMVRISVGV